MSRRPFTLIETLVVVAIISILAAIGDDGDPQGVFVATAGD